MACRGSVASHLTSAIKQFQKRRNRHIRESFSGDAAEVLGLIEGMAKAVFDMGHSVVRPAKTDRTGSKPHLSALSEQLVTALLSKDTPAGWLLRDLELVIAEAFSLQTDQMANRCLDIARIALPQRPGQTVDRFLQRLGRCYMAGFFPESIIVCRAILENAIIEKFEREGEPLPIPAPGKSEMRARLVRAEERNWLTSRQRHEAWAIWERGSKAAHRDPQVTTAVLETINKTIMERFTRLFHYRSLALCEWR